MHHKKMERRRAEEEEEEEESSIKGELFWNMGSIVRRLTLLVLSGGTIPTHMCFIMDGNRRYAKKRGLSEAAGYAAGFLSVIKILKYCYHLGVKFVTIYAFSIDNYKRSPHQVGLLMGMMEEKMKELTRVEGVVNQFGVRVHFAGNMALLWGPVREAAMRVMAETEGNRGAMLVVCVAYTSTEEITQAVGRSCMNKEGGGVIEVGDVERRMYMGGAPEPDILVRTSGECRLSNFMLWQTGCSLLYSPMALWPEIGLWHLFWAVLCFQRHSSYLSRLKKKMVVAKKEQDEEGVWVD